MDVAENHSALTRVKKGTFKLPSTFRQASISFPIASHSKNLKTTKILEDSDIVGPCAKDKNEGFFLYAQYYLEIKYSVATVD